jgi:sarcosine oxidase gamma subunit
VCGATAVLAPAAAAARPAPAAVSGRLVTADGRPLLNAAIALSTAEDAAPMPGIETTIQPDGRFALRGLAPGRYVIRARGVARAGGRTLFAQYALTITDEDVSGLVLTLERGMVLDGSVTYASTQGTRRPEAGTLHIRAPLTDGSGFGDALTGAVARDGRFTIRGLMEGTHQIVVEGLQHPWVLARVTWRGRDITDEVIDADPASPMHDVRVTLADEAALVSGTVRSADDRAAAAVDVLIFPAAAPRRLPTSRRVRAVRTDDHGSWTVYGLPPGDYLAVAGADVEAGLVTRPAEFEALAAAATPFSIPNPQARLTLDLRVRDRGASAPSLR